MTEDRERLMEEIREALRRTAKQSTEKPQTTKSEVQTSSKPKTKEKRKQTAPVKKATKDKKATKVALPVKQKADKPVRAVKPKKTTVEKFTAPVMPRGKSAHLKVMFFGGVGEIGKNMTALECGGDIVIIDAGVTFPGDDMPGIDLVLPDIRYLVENKHKVRGTVITHGHEDHVGGLPYLLKEIETPVYATKLTLALAENKLREHHLATDCLKTVAAGEVIQLGCFSVEFIGVNHSIAGSLALAITTPAGVVFHSGDYKIDHTPVAGQPMDLARISEIGKKGVLLMMAESTNVERPGFAMSEKVVGETLNHLFNENEGRRLIIATFASNVHRMQQIIDLAVKYRRKVAFSGRSMISVAEAAARIGELRLPKDVVVDIDKIKNIPDGQLLILSTGSQGEPMSALTRMASGEFKEVKVGNNDTVILSASPIPGNEKMVYGVINNLYRLGAKVVYESLEKIHVSGHACQEELKTLHALVKPKFFIPVHGEYRHLCRHVDLAVGMGLRPDNAMIVDIGNTVVFTPSTMKRGESFPAGARLVDGLDIDDGESGVLRDRRHLSEDGMLVVVVGVSKVTGEIVSGPDIINKGVMTDGGGLTEEAKTVVAGAIAQADVKAGTDKAQLYSTVRRALRNYVFRKTKKNPMVIPVIMEV